MTMTSTIQVQVQVQVQWRQVQYIAAISLLGLKHNSTAIRVETFSFTEITSHRCWYTATCHFFERLTKQSTKWHASYKLVSSFYPFVKITFQCRAQSNINLISWQFSSDIKLHTGWSIMCRASMPMEQIIGGTVINIQNGGERDFSKARPWLVSDKIIPCSFVNVVAIDWSELSFILDHDFHCTSCLRWSSQCRRCKNSLTRSQNLSAFLGGW